MKVRETWIFMKMLMNKMLPLIFVLMIVPLGACKSRAPFTDNGNPGQIKVITFYDDNQNGQLDGSETGTFVRVGISQDISCPAGSLERINQMDSDANGIGVFKDLKPGRYCVTLIGNYGMTTKMNPEVYLSSDQEIVVRLGLTR